MRARRTYGRERARAPARWCGRAHTGARECARSGGHGRHETTKCNTKNARQSTATHPPSLPDTSMAVAAPIRLAVGRSGVGRYSPSATWLSAVKRQRRGVDGHHGRGCENLARVPCFAISRRLPTRDVDSSRFLPGYPTRTGPLPRLIALMAADRWVVATWVAPGDERPLPGNVVPSAAYRPSWRLAVPDVPYRTCRTGRAVPDVPYRTCRTGRAVTRRLARPVACDESLRRPTRFRPPPLLSSSGVRGTRSRKQPRDRRESRRSAAPRYVRDYARRGAARVRREARCLRLADRVMCAVMSARSQRSDRRENRSLMEDA
jgi:hypothetical protein